MIETEKTCMYGNEIGRCLAFLWVSSDSELFVSFLSRRALFFFFFFVSFPFPFFPLRACRCCAFHHCCYSLTFVGRTSLGAEGCVHVYMGGVCAILTLYI